jgi:hypothetical protein
MDEGIFLFKSSLCRCMKEPDSAAEIDVKACHKQRTNYEGSLNKSINMTFGERAYVNICLLEVVSFA